MAASPASVVMTASHLAHPDRPRWCSLPSVEKLQPVLEHLGAARERQVQEAGHDGAHSQDQQGDEHGGRALVGGSGGGARRRGAGRPPHPRYWAPRTAWWRRATAGAGRPRPARRQPGGSGGRRRRPAHPPGLGGGHRLAGLAQAVVGPGRGLLRLLQVLARLLQLAAGRSGTAFLASLSSPASLTATRAASVGRPARRHRWLPPPRTGRWPGHSSASPAGPGRAHLGPGRLGGGVLPRRRLRPGPPGCPTPPRSPPAWRRRAVATGERHEHLAAHVEGGQYGRDPATAHSPTLPSQA